MHQEGMNYPLHLGVTEAGEGEDGRIKSAAGIGTLLEDGIGDTIRVSLTEDPEFEIPVAKALVNRYTQRAHHDEVRPYGALTMSADGVVTQSDGKVFPFNPLNYSRRGTSEVLNIGAAQVPRVIADFSSAEKITAASFFPVGYAYSVPTDKWNLSDQACDFIYTGNKTVDFGIPGTLGIIMNAQSWMAVSDRERTYPFFCGDEIFSAAKVSPVLNFVEVDAAAIADDVFPVGKLPATAVLVLSTANEHAMPALRRAMVRLQEQSCMLPVIIRRKYEQESEELLQLHASTDLGGLLLDGFGDGVMISTNGQVSPQKINSLAFGILQAARTRISKTEYISCPSCGRTLFDLQETTAKIRSVTDHLKGLKIGIMGCIVNGPGEMADADYGYVGSGAGKITLYKGKEVVRRSIDAEHAVEALIDLIREHGDWVEK